MTTRSKIAFLGGGNMARALLRGCLTRAGYAPEQLGVTDISEAARSQLHSELGVQVFTENQAAARWADVVVLAVKPQVLPLVLGEIAPQLPPDKLVISIAAGVGCERIRDGLQGHVRIVRAMPNTPALVGAAATAIAAGRGATSEDVAFATALFRSVGEVVAVAETSMDAVTGLSGSGPAYAFVAIEALSDAGVRAGLARDVATKLAAQTLLGAAQLVLETGDHPAKLKDMVTSPGGTTIAGLAAAERAGLRHALQAAVEAAVARAKELG
ncbi:MAG TPA: pyrroline-5-carboxylate reductase [Polyangiales bacterium]